MSELVVPLESEGFCARVRTSCAAVVDSAHFVRIDDAAIDAVAASLAPIPTPPDRPTGDLAPADEATATLVLALAAINFGSGYHDIVRKRPGLSGARTMAAALRDYVDATGPLTSDRLLRFTAADTSQVFGQELDGGALETLMTRFAEALVDLGTFLDERGGAVAAIASARRSAERLAAELTAMPFFRDLEHLDGQPVWFHKRAQIASADLARTFDVELFDDLGELTAFADNLVPHVLRIDGAIELAPSVVATIDAGDLLEPGSRAEVEIRAAGVVAVESLAERLSARPMDVDLALWERGGGPHYKRHPRHRARSTAY